MRLREINERWIASADTPDGPLGLGDMGIDVIEGDPLDLGAGDAPIVARAIMRRPQCPGPF